MPLGPGMSPDSVDYAFAAHTFAASGRFQYLGGDPLTLFPPGLPALLGALEALGVSIPTAAMALNALCAAATILLTFRISMDAIGSLRTSLVVATIVGASAATLRVYTMLWTEPLFTVLALLMLCLLTRASRRRELTWWGIAAVGLLASLACVLRFAGAILVPVAVVSALLIEPDRGIRERFLRASAVGMIGSIGFAAVAARNVALGVPAMGIRTQNGFAWGRIAEDTSKTLGGHVLALWTPLWELAGLVVILALLAALVLVLRRRDLPMTPVSLYVVGYWTLLLYSEHATTIDPVSPRFTVPVLAPMVILLAWAASHLQPNAQVPAQTRLISGCAAATGLAVIVLNLLTVPGLLRQFANGRGYASDAMIHSPLAAALDQPPAGQLLAVSDLPRTYWTTGIDAVVPIPRIDRWTTPEKTSEMIARLEDLIDHGAVRSLVFFDRNTAGPMRPEDLVQRGIQIRMDRRFADGEIWVPGGGA